jgi:IstB-like ATP binding protein
VDPVNTLKAETRAGKAERIAGQLMRPDVLVVDELGYLPFAQLGGQLLFLTFSHSIQCARVSAIGHACRAQLCNRFRTGQP